MKTIIVYCSMTGNTELIADSIAKEFTALGEQVEIKDAMDTYAEDLKAYERILIGSYTWGDGELPDEFLDFYDELQNISLAGKLAAAFGSGDSCYDNFGGAVDILEETLKNQGCEILTQGLKVDQESEETIKTLSQSFARDVCSASLKLV